MSFLPKLKSQKKECAVSIKKKKCSLGLNVDAGIPLTCTNRVHPVSFEKNKARPVTHCVLETVGSDGSSAHRDTF